MICKNCGKEISNGANTCPSCGTKIQIDAAAFQAAVAAAPAETAKKKYPTKLVIGAIIAAIVIIIIAIAASGGEDESGSSSSSKVKSKADTSSFFEDTFDDSEENVIKTLAISKIKDENTYDSDVYDVTILDKDGQYNYIVRGWTKSPDLIAKWWTVMIKLDINTGKMTTYIKGEYTESNVWIDNFKNESEYGWGKENHIE